MERMKYDQFWNSLKEPSHKHYDDSDIERGDIAYIRNKVLQNLFAGVIMADDGVVLIAGQAFFEMLYVNKVLGLKDSYRIFDDEIWYIAEWLQKNRISYKINGRNLYRYKTEEIAKYLVEPFIYQLPERIEILPRYNCRSCIFEKKL